VTEDPATGPTGDGLGQPAPSVAGWAEGAESVDDRDGTPFAPGEDTVRLSLGGHQPVPGEDDAPTVRSRPVPAPAPGTAVPPEAPLGPRALTFPAQDAQQPAVASQQPAQAQPAYQPQTPYQPQPYLQTLQPQPGQQAQPPAQQAQPVQPQAQPYPAPGYLAQPFQQPGYIQPAIYVQPTMYGQPGYPQPAVFPPPAVFQQPIFAPPGTPQAAVPPTAPLQPAAQAQQVGLAGPPAMLAAAADRERAVDVLKAAFGEGRITKEEFDSRVNQVAQARTYADLGVVTADLPAGPLGGVSHYQGGLPAPAPYYPPARQSTNGLAIGALICSLVFPFLSLPAVVMGNVARKQIRERNESGDGLAVAALVIGWLGLAFWALVFIMSIVAAGGGGS
jgi:hypothetical protein